MQSGATSAIEPAPEPDGPPLAGRIVRGLAGLLAVLLIIFLALFALDWRAARRSRSVRPSRGGISGALVWGLLAGFWIYWFYTTLPLPFPPAFPDFWRMPQTDLVTFALLGWVAFSLISAWYPRVKSISGRADIMEA